MTSWYVGVGPLLPSSVPGGHPHCLVPFCCLVSSLSSGTPGSGGGWSSSALHLTCHPCCSHTPYSPHEQLLMAVLGGVGCHQHRWGASSLPCNYRCESKAIGRQIQPNQHCNPTLA
ncbi:hypothetical protein L208DRAFT_1408083 [Tricholoma matsutake]|nr:hypothetical protein L208DRAFT_1408083 [Tricholoma matsutake 945]